MSHYVACLITTCRGDLHSEPARDPAQPGFVRLDEHGQALLNIERHELHARRVVTKGRLDDGEARGYLGERETGLQREQAQQNFARETSTCDCVGRFPVRRVLSVLNAMSSHGAILLIFSSRRFLCHCSHRRSIVW